MDPWSQYLENPIKRIGAKYMQTVWTEFLRKKWQTNYRQR